MNRWQRVLHRHKPEHAVTYAGGPRMVWCQCGRVYAYRPDRSRPTVRKTLGKDRA